MPRGNLTADQAIRNAQGKVAARDDEAATPPPKSARSTRGTTASTVAPVSMVLSTSEIRDRGWMSTCIPRVIR